MSVNQILLSFNGYSIYFRYLRLFVFFSFLSLAILRYSQQQTVRCFVVSHSDWIRLASWQCCSPAFFNLLSFCYRTELSIISELRKGHVQKFAHFIQIFLDLAFVGWYKKDSEEYDDCQWHCWRYGIRNADQIDAKEKQNTNCTARKCWKRNKNSEIQKRSTETIKKNNTQRETSIPTKK